VRFCGSPRGALNNKRESLQLLQVHAVTRFNKLNLRTGFVLCDTTTACTVILFFMYFGYIKYKIKILNGSLYTKIALRPRLAQAVYFRVFIDRVIV